MRKKREHLPVRSNERFPMKGFGFILLFSVSLVLGGCGGEAPKPTKVPMPPVGKKPGVPAPIPSPTIVEARAQAAPVAIYTYDPKGKPDPFRPLVVERPETPLPLKPKKVEEVSAGGVTPLERMDLAQLKLVAVIWNVPDPKGMVEDGTGKGYVLSIGTSIGKHKGKVTQITPKGVMVSEKHETSPGKFKTHEVTLKLYPE
ncbi:MAG: pilus assembly protein PilP [Deltaproteobacteria bacterium]|nr:pilus assembly protein PilP [Deltaproteobacteria bacterium]